MTACLSPEGLAAYTQAATIIIYGGIAGAVAWVGFAIRQMHWDAANRKRRIDGIEPIGSHETAMREAQEQWARLRAEDYYRNGGEI